MRSCLPEHRHRPVGVLVPDPHLEDLQWYYPRIAGVRGSLSAKSVATELASNEKDLVRIQIPRKKQIANFDRTFVFKPKYLVKKFYDNSP